MCVYTTQAFGNAENGYVKSALTTFVSFNFSRRDFRRQVVYSLACFLDKIQRESSEILAIKRLSGNDYRYRVFKSNR